MALLHLDPLPRNATPGEVLRFVASHGKLDGKRVGKITLLGNTATVEVPDGVAGKLVAVLDGATFRDRPARARFAQAFRPTDGGHFDTLAKLLQLEADAEREQMKQRAARGTADDGTAITALHVFEDDVGLGGRLILSFRRANRSDPLPPNRLQPGAPALLTQTGTTRPATARGVVSDRTERTISVAFESDFDWPDDANWRLDLSPDEAARQRQLAALSRVRDAKDDRLAELRDSMASVTRQSDELLAEGGTRHSNE